MCEWGFENEFPTNRFEGAVRSLSLMIYVDGRRTYRKIFFSSAPCPCPRPEPPPQFPSNNLKLYWIRRRMCDLLDDPGGVAIPTSRKSSNAESLGLTLGNYDRCPGVRCRSRNVTLTFLWFQIQNQTKHHRLRPEGNFQKHRYRTFYFKPFRLGFVKNLFLLPEVGPETCVSRARFAWNSQNIARWRTFRIVLFSETIIKKSRAALNVDNIFVFLSFNPPWGNASIQRLHISLMVDTDNTPLIAFSSIYVQGVL